MQPLKDGSRHGPAVGVEMTMSLSGPPGLHRHTTVHTDSLYHYMSRQQQQQQSELQHKLMPAEHKDVVNSRAPSTDHRVGIHDNIGPGRDHRLVSQDVRPPNLDLKPADGLRGVHDPRGGDILISKDVVRGVPDHHSQHSPQLQQHQQHHPSSSRKYPDLRGGMMPHDKSNLTNDSGSSRESALLGPSRPGSSHTSQQPQLSLQDPRMAGVSMTGVYSYDLQSPYTSQMSPASINSMISPSGAQRKPGSIQLSPSGQSPGMSTSLAYSVQKSAPGRTSDGFATSGLHPLHGHDPVHSYMAAKQIYHEDYNKTVPGSHFMPDMVKGVQVPDPKQMGQHQILAQHRDLVRDSGSELRGQSFGVRDSGSELNDLRYSSNSRALSKPGMEMAGHLKLAGDSSHTSSARTAVEDQLSKSTAYMNTLASPFGKGQEPQSSIPKALAYSSGAESIPRSGHDTFTSIPHSSVQSGQHLSYPPSSQRHPDTAGQYLDSDQRVSSHVQKSVGVIRPPWRDGYHTSVKQTGPAFHTDDMLVHSSKSCIPRHHDLESSQSPLHSVVPPRIQGSISTGQPRIMYDSTKPISYPDHVLQSSTSERYSMPQKDHVSPRPSSVGRSAQFQQSVPAISYDERTINEPAEKSLGGAETIGGSSTSALDLTKLTSGSGKPADSPLDLTVKTKKRRADDRETPEYDRMLSAAKRQKIDTSIPRSGLQGQKGVMAMQDSPNNSIWLSSPSPRSTESYEPRPVQSPAYTNQSSMARPLKYSQGQISDGRNSADNRVVRERINPEPRSNRDGRVSVENRSSLDHHTLPMGTQHGKMTTSSMVPEMVRHAVGTNPTMVPLTTQLQKVKEEQAYQMKMQRMGGEATLPAHTERKQLYKDSASPRHMELLSASPNELVVVRHSQQHYDINQQSQQQQSSQHAFIKQQPCLQVQQMQPSHHQQKVLSGQQEIIELGMKDSSDPLQAARASHFGLRAFPNQASLMQQPHHHQKQQQQQMCIVQQRQFSPKEQQPQQQQLSSYPHTQQAMYSKEQQQQSLTKEQLQFINQQHYPRGQYSNKRSEEMERFYNKQQQHQLQQLQHRKRIDLEDYKQALASPQAALSGAQKWGSSHQQRPAVKPTYPQCQPAPGCSADYRAPKVPSAGYPRSPSSTRMPRAREYDNYRYGYFRPELQKSSEAQKSTLPQVAGPLPAGGVREESRRALSRRESYSGSSAPGGAVAEVSKQLDSMRKKSTSSLPERVESRGEPESIHANSNSSVPGKLTEAAVDGGLISVEDTKGEVSHSSPSPIIPAQLAGAGLKPEGLTKDLAPIQSAAQFAVPLSLTIPPTSLASSVPSPASRPAAAHKAWSRKHMILNAVNQDESLKRIICSSAGKHDPGGISSDCRNRIIVNSTCSPIPTSPKMPILSPQDDDGEAVSEDQGVRVTAQDDDPPTLNPSEVEQTKPSVTRNLPHPQTAVGAAGHAGGQACSSAVSPENCLVKETYKNKQDLVNNNVKNFTSMSISIAASMEASVSESEEIPGKTIVVRRCTIADSLTEQQQHEDSLKTQSGSMPYQRAEVIRRNSLAGHALGPWVHMKNIPIANVAPFVHSRDDDDKSKQQKLEDQQLMEQRSVNFSTTDSTFVLSGQTPETPKEVLTKSEVRKGSASVGGTDAEKTDDPRTQDKEDSNLSASSSSKSDTSAKRKKLTKLRVSSPTTMKELELISSTLEYAVLKSSGIDEMKVLDKVANPGSVRKSLGSRIKYKHKIIREKNKIVKQKKVVKKRIQYVFDDDEEEENDEPMTLYDDDDDEDFEVDGGSKGGKNTSKVDAESKARDREERALRREQLRDQSEEGAARTPVPVSLSSSSSSTSSTTPTTKTRDKGNTTTTTTTTTKQRTRNKESVTSDRRKQVASKHRKTASRISRRRLSSTNQRAQELKHIALVQRRKTGKRKIRRYNRNAAYEQELHREANRRAVVRAKRQASSKARERLQQQQRDLSQDGDNDDNLSDETWKLPETRGASGAGRKSHQNIPAKHGGNRGSGKSLSSSHAGKSSTSGGQQRKEDYESDVENVPDDLAAEMVSDDNGNNNSSRKRKSRAGKSRAARREESEQKAIDGHDMSGAEDEPYSEDDTRTGLMRLPIENVPVPADVKKLTINKNSGETLLHRAARSGHEEITLYCLKTQTVYVNARDNAGYTPLHESCVRGSVAVARHLIYHGADVNCCSQDGIRPIHDAIENEHVEVVRLLLVHGADPLIATYAGRTPLRIARSLLMLRTLQGYIADLNGGPEEGEGEDDDDEEEESEVLPWRFTSSLTFLGSSQAESYSPCVDLPCDPPDDSSDVFDDGPTSAINVFNLALDGEDRTPQPFCLLDEVIHRLNMSEDKLTSLFPWKPTSVTLSSERVREVASCCCSNVSIRLPQSGKVTLLPFSTLNKIERALKQQTKEKKEDRKTGGKKINSSSCVPILTRLEQPASFLEEGLDKDPPLKNTSSFPSSSSFLVKQKPKLSVLSSSSFTSSLTSTSSLVFKSSSSGAHKSTKFQSSTSQEWPAPITDQQSCKKLPVGHHRQHHLQLDQHSPSLQQHSQQRSPSSDVALTIKSAGPSKESRSSSSSSSILRKSKKDDCETPWLNTPMFSDDSSSSPFHTSLDCFDSDNSI